MRPTGEESDKDDELDDEVTNYLSPRRGRAERDKACSGDHGEYERGEPKIVEFLAVLAVKHTDRVEVAERSV